MLSQSPYYWGSIRKVVESFGVVFSDIHIVRVDHLGNVVNQMLVPIEYGPKEKWFVRNTQNPMPGTDDQIEMTLPRMSYEVTGFVYDQSRKMTSTGRTVKAMVSDNRVVKSQFNPVPYNIGFSLNIMTKTMEDSLMIIEQILPFFTPDYTLNVNDVPELHLVKDIPVVLNNVQHDDSWEGTFQDRRTITWTLTFTAKAYLYPPIRLEKVIVHSNINTFLAGGRTGFSAYAVPVPANATAETATGINVTIIDRSCTNTNQMIVGAACIASTDKRRQTGTARVRR